MARINRTQGSYPDTGETGEVYDIDLSTTCFCSPRWHKRCAAAKNRTCRCKCKGRCHGIKKQPKIDTYAYTPETKAYLDTLPPSALPEE